MPSLEIAAFTLPSALLAARSGAHRIELCSDKSVGGITPPVETLVALKSSDDVRIPVHVMIRPRGGDFIYTTPEFEMMKASIIALKETGADGFVFGILKPISPPHPPSPSPSSSSPPSPPLTLNTTQLIPLLRLAHPKPCIFHRAFDHLPLSHMIEELETLIELGFAGVLTSGGIGERGARDGVGILRALVRRAAGRIDVVVGGGVRGGDVGWLRGEFEGGGKRGEVRWWHSSAVVGEGEEVCVEEVGRLLEGLRDE